MIGSNRLVQIACVLVAAVCLAISGGLSVSLSAEAGRAQLVYTDTAEEGDPPQVGVAIALGAFRGLFVNYLWMRANALKEEGKFYEAIELSSLITRLQPRFPRVWAFHAWNMAYNISVATNTDTERWQWVNAGINLLRSEGLRANPNDILLHKELAWIFFHKVGGFADDANRFYKRKLAEEWTFVLGTPPNVPQGDPERATEIMADWFEPVADAPRSLGRLIDSQREAYAQAERLEEGTRFRAPIEDLLQELSRLGVELDRDLLETIALIDRVNQAWTLDNTVQLVQLPQNPQNQAIIELRENEQYAGAWEALLPFIRKKVLIEQYNMEPARMLRYTREFGPLDWRHSATHAIYWSRRGVEVGLARQSLTNYETVNTDRTTVHAVQDLFRTGTILYDPISDSFLQMPDINFAHTYGDIVDELIERNNNTQGKDRAFTLFSAGYENFLKDVIRVYYRRGEIARAREYYDRLRVWNGLNTNDPAKLEELKQPLDEYVRNSLFDRLQTPHVAASEVYSSLRVAFLQGLLNNDSEVFARELSWARQVHNAFWQQQTTRQFVASDRERMELMPRRFEETIEVGFIMTLQQSGLDRVQISTIYRGMPAQVQALVYDGMVGFARNMRMTEEQFQVMFPEPPGLERARQRIREREQQFREAREQLEIEQQ